MKTLHNIFQSLRGGEKLIAWILVSIFVMSSLVLIMRANQLFMVTIPAHGGILREGIIGTPRFINPVLALTDTDRDMTNLVYAGLMKYQNGILVPDIAQSYTVSEDNLRYTFTLREDAYFHDDTPVTAQDIAFTVLKIKDQSIKSPRRANWEGVEVEVIDTKQISFTLKKPYSPFISNTTLGIIPEHIWKNIEADNFTFSQFNVEPIGAGPYRVVSSTRDDQGLPKTYTLEAWKYTLGRPFIKDLIISFYPNERELIQALNDGAIDSVHGLTAQDTDSLATTTAITTTHSIIHNPLPRIFSVFFNQNNAPILRNLEVRQALNVSVDRKSLIEQVFSGYATPRYSLIHSNMIQEMTPENLIVNSSSTIEAGISILTKSGWIRNPEGIFEYRGKKDTSTTTLSLTLSTSNVPELKKTAEFVASTWRALGVDTVVEVYEIGDLNQNIIRPRKYEAILFGQNIGNDADFYAFWHSSQRNDPGLNIALYANSVVDKALEDARITSDEARVTHLATAQEELSKDIPAIALYAPDFIYIVPHTLKNVSTEGVTTVSDRWNTVSNWYTKTDKIWAFLVPYVNRPPLSYLYRNTVTPEINNK